MKVYFMVMNSKRCTYEEAAKKYGEDPSIINQNLLNEAKEILE